MTQELSRIIIEHKKSNTCKRQSRQRMRQRVNALRRRPRVLGEKLITCDKSKRTSVIIGNFSPNCYFAVSLVRRNK
jgi:hypothetical protein